MKIAEVAELAVEERRTVRRGVINALPERTVKPGEKIVKCEICTRKEVYRRIT